MEDLAFFEYPWAVVKTHVTSLVESVLSECDGIHSFHLNQMERPVMPL